MQILLADDDSQSRHWLADFLRELGHEVTEVSNGLDAWQKLQAREYHLLLTDHYMPGMSGIQLIKEFKSTQPEAIMEIILFTAYGDALNSISALRAGAYDYLMKPLRLEELNLLIDKIEQQQILKRNNEILTEAMQASLPKPPAEKMPSPVSKAYLHLSGEGMLGIHSPAMKTIMDQANTLHKNRNIPLLIEGETGTGKELVARYVHYGNNAAPSVTPFVALNCAALTPTLLESELFGYEGGAFTSGRAGGQKGKLDLASGGTLFLDEISELSLEAQAKLLRVLEEKEFYRVGGLKLIQTNVRIIAASNRNLNDAVMRGLFRADLYYRLSAAKILLPPLRMRNESIIPLANDFLEEFSSNNPTKNLSLSNEAEQVLSRYSWPGNIRELRNVIQYAALQAEADLIDVRHLGPLSTEVPPQENTCGNPGLHGPILNERFFALPPDGLNLQELENTIISKALDMHHGNKSQTAAYLGISRSSLYRHLARLNHLN